MAKKWWQFWKRTPLQKHLSALTLDERENRRQIISLAKAINNGRARRIIEVEAVSRCSFDDSKDLSSYCSKGHSSDSSNDD